MWTSPYSRSYNTSHMPRLQMILGYLLVIKCDCRLWIRLWSIQSIEIRTCGWDM